MALIPALIRGAIAYRNEKENLYRQAQQNRLLEQRQEKGYTFDLEPDEHSQLANGLMPPEMGGDSFAQEQDFPMPKMPKITVPKPKQP